MMASLGPLVIVWDLEVVNVHIEPQMVNDVILLANTNKQSLVKESGPVFFHVLSVALKKFAKQNILENKNINGICRFLHSPNEKP